MKMRILMLNPPFWGKFSRSSRSPGISKGGCVYYPIWMGYATGWLEKQGHKVMLVDAPAIPISEEESLKISKEFDPELIVVDSVTASINNDIKVVEDLRKQHNDAFIAMVGTHPSAMPVQTLKMSQADAVTLEEYDFTLAELADLLEKKQDVSQVKGLALKVKENGTEQIRINEKRQQITGEELDQFPFVSEVYSRHLNIKDYFYPSVLYPEITIITGRGCPFKCTFCVLPQVMNGHTYRARSPENTVAELQWIHDNLPEVKDIMIEDDTFTVDRLRLAKISDLITESGLKTTFTVNSRADMDLVSLKKLKQAGCRLMCVGFESADQGVLDNIKKQTRLPKIKQFVKDSKEAGLLIHGCFMMGNSGETKETIRKTVEMAKELDPDTAQFFPIMVYPGTAAYNWALDNGYLKTTKWDEWLLPDGTHNTIVSTDKLSAEELVRECDRARVQFYLRPKFMARKLKQIIREPADIPRTVKSSFIFAKYLAKEIKANF